MHTYFSSVDILRICDKICYELIVFKGIAYQLLSIQFSNEIMY